MVRLLILIGILVLIDVYAYQVVRQAMLSYSDRYALITKWLFWSFSFIIGLSVVLLASGKLPDLPRFWQTFFQGSLLLLIVPKLFLAIFALLDDLLRGGKWIVSLFDTPTLTAATDESKGITRSDFIAQTGIAVAALPIVVGSYGIISGAHDYKVRHRKVPIKSLPKSFNGLRIAQLSDIHSGSFWNKKAVIGGVEMVMKEKADMICFTGDLVNNRAIEMKEYGDVFKKLTAPMGVYSILGNHDYGDYHTWESQAAKRKNLADLKEIQRQMGWRLLLDEHITFKEGRDEISLVGIQNWGAKARFPKYGNLAKALEGTGNSSSKILLSHDPSHWRAQVLKEGYKDIDLMLSGHTHGAQFGVETANYRWSPIKLMYEEWADLYQEKDQYLYVNRGFGYLGFPGRLGILPEITILELQSV